MRFINLLLCSAFLIGAVAGPALAGPKVDSAKAELKEAKQAKKDAKKALRDARKEERKEKAR